MSDPFIGEIRMFAGTFAPRGWAFCDGQLQAISQNTALFSLLGTTYAGDGRTTFGLPEMRGRIPVHPGTGPGLQPVRLGQRVGYNSNSDNRVTHDISIDRGVAVNQTKETIQQPSNHPTLCINFIIALVGIYPSRS